MHKSRGPKQRVSDEVLGSLIARYRAGEPIAGLAEEAGYTYAGLHRAFERRGVKPDGRRRVIHPLYVRQDDLRVVEALRLRDQGMGYVRASETVGISSAALKRILIETGRDPQKHWKGEGSPSWKGGRQINAQGYVRVRLADDDPLIEMAGREQMVSEHRLVMARHLGRSLERNETIHHKNGKRDDNRIENLQLRKGKHGNGSAWRCADCGSTHIVPANLD
jgi:hypothetical protein